MVSRVLRGSVSYQGPVCAECQEKHLFVDTDGEYVLKPDHALPTAAEPLGAARIRKHGAALVVPPKFDLGQVVATPEALRRWRRAGSRLPSSSTSTCRGVGALWTRRISG